MYQILIAAKHPQERSRLADALQNHFGSACTIHSSDSGIRALELFTQHKPQAAILDIQLPDIGGLETARRIRLTGQDCVLLFLSDHSTYSLARQILSLRAVDYLLRPYPIRELITVLEQALQITDRPCCPSGAIHPDPMDSDPRLFMIRQNIERYLREHYAEDLSMQMVAKAMNYSDAYFCKLFKQCFHANFSAWLNDFRVQQAKTLLMDTQLSIHEVSRACGYADANYFARIFRRVTGKTPTQYRMQ